MDTKATIYTKEKKKNKKKYKNCCCHSAVVTDSFTFFRTYLSFTCFNFFFFIIISSYYSLIHKNVSHKSKNERKNNRDFLSFLQKRKKLYFALRFHPFCYRLHPYTFIFILCSVSAWRFLVNILQFFFFVKPKPLNGRFIIIIIFCSSFDGRCNAIHPLHFLFHFFSLLVLSFSSSYFFLVFHNLIAYCIVKLLLLLNEKRKIKKSDKSTEKHSDIQKKT